MSKTRPAVFLDRDGTLMEEVHYCSDPARVRVFPGASDALRGLMERGFLTVIVTNQSGIGRGLLDHRQYEAVQAELLRQLGASLISATYCCPDLPPSPQRKPEPVMVFEAARDLGIDLARSWFVGDKSVDIECGRRAGVRTILVRTGYGAREYRHEIKPDYVAKDIVAAASFILENGDAKSHDQRND